MDQYQEQLTRHELEINRSTSMICLYELAIVTVIEIMDRFRVFAVYSYAKQISWKLALVAALILPFLLVRAFRCRERWVKYVIMSCSVIASGLCYVIFNVQAQLLLVFPTVLVTMYYNKSLSYYTCALSVVVLFVTYLLAGYLLLPKMIRNPFGYRYVMVDTAIPQAIYYICFAILVQLLNARTLDLMTQFYQKSRENEMLSLEKETAELRGRIQERERISRDIHNSVGHTITAAIFALEAAKLQRPTEPEAADEKTERAIQRMRESMDVIRNSVRMMDQRNIMSLQELEKLLTLCCRQTEQDSDVRIETDFSGLVNALDAPMSSDRIGFLYGMVQECVTNGMKHGGAERIRLKVGMKDGMLATEVWNNGKVPDKTPTEGFGLQKLRTYAEKAGGTFRIITSYGFTVAMTLPMENL